MPGNGRAVTARANSGVPTPPLLRVHFLKVWRCVNYITQQALLSPVAVLGQENRHFRARAEPAGRDFRRPLRGGRFGVCWVSPPDLRLRKAGLNWGDESGKAREEAGAALQ